ncbi:ribosomal protein L7/L12 [Wielerella bovis]|uniref:ribosomal protein L7/L12 n=1 Tax=Wielerella bovis TaxID=2917790 RepID=UPI002019320A|nr:ribosomal protein L7/L12 [Wielerella bovis]MCG7656238.1 ribosomal protein L7/L12 [Wielerella bovis]MCG7658463.1 ribosomal protein L7/L12 [Wielerella bovis]
MDNLNLNAVMFFIVIAYMIGSYVFAKQSMSDTDKLVALLLGNPDVKKWLQQNTTSNQIADIKAIRQEFGLGLVQAKKLLELYHQQS